MSSYRVCFVYCDTEGCLSEVEDARPTVAEVRATGVSQGWIRRRGKDHCPLHGGDMAKATYDVRLRVARESAPVAAPAGGDPS